VKPILRSLSAAALFALCACDWVGEAFLNSIPVQGTATGDFYVYLAVDGLSLRTVQDAAARGAFSGPQWKVAKFVTMFPGTSDASWTRILHTPKIPGYEFEYYDPRSDSLVNSGLAGVGRHLMPTVSESLSFEAPYLAAFDYRANGYTHSFEAYRDTWVSLGDSLDNLFFTLEGRAETDSVFTAYLLESDVLGHIATPEDCAKMLSMLADRIEQFRTSHPRRAFHFTLLSDHGMDFAGIQGDHLLDFKDELPKVGITAVRSLAGRDPRKEVYAIPVVHTRVTYLALHTHPDLIAEVGSRIARLESVDFTASRIAAPAGAPAAREWYGLWSEGRLAASFGYVPETSSYVIPASAGLARFGMPLGFAAGEAFKTVPDEELFERSKDGKYPDLFYRVRTALTDVGVDFPSDVLVSFRTHWGSVGFRLPGGLDAFAGGSHGAADDAGTLGVLISDERDLPDAVRADGFLALFPHAAQHLRDRGLKLLEGDPDAARPHL
jgi:hypothetical protein